MEYGICPLSVVPVRAEPTDRAEIVTQLIFGECYTILLTQGNWVQIRIAADQIKSLILQITPDCADANGTKNRKKS